MPGGPWGEAAGVPGRGAGFGVRVAAWWLLLETGAVALVAGIVGVLVYAAEVVVGGIEVIAGTALLLAPILVRQVALRVHRRWTALVVAYGVLLAVSVPALVVGDIVLLHTVAGFGAAALGALASGAGFVLASRMFAPKARPRDVRAPAEYMPIGEPVSRPVPPDESDSDTLPQVIPHDDEREDDSLAG